MRQAAVVRLENEMSECTFQPVRPRSVCIPHHRESTWTTVVEGEGVTRGDPRRRI
mgnify:CR=1 FL=1